MKHVTVGSIKDIEDLLETDEPITFSNGNGDIGVFVKYGNLERASGYLTS